MVVFCVQTSIIEGDINHPNTIIVKWIEYANKI